MVLRTLLFGLCLGVLELAGAEWDRLPDWIRIGGELRGRAEVYAGSDKLPGATEWYYLNRVRLNTDLRFSPRVRVFVQLQDSRAASPEGIHAPPALSNHADLRQGYLQLGNAEDKGWFVRAGRQPLAFGGARLLWQSEWGNVGPGFDGVRLAFASERMDLNWFGAFAVRNVQDQWDRPSRDRQIHGFYANFRKLVPRSTIEPFALWKHNRVALCERGGAGHSDIATYGFRATGKPLKQLDYISDFALQSGHISQDRASAWAGHWEVGVQPRNAAPRVFGEYQRASGDNRSGDGTHGSFDQLYPAWKFGTADAIGWSNMQEAVAGAEWKVKGWQPRAAYHRFWLLSLADCLYAANGTVLVRGGQGTSRGIGGEIDLRFSRQLTHHLHLMAGVGRFLPGRFWKQTRRTGPITYPFLMWTYQF